MVGAPDKLVITRMLVGIASLVVVVCHASWKWAGAGGHSYPGTFGTVGPVFFVALLLWPMFAVSALYIPIILFGRRSEHNPKTVAILFVPMLLYGIYFLIVGGSGLRAGAT